MATVRNGYVVFDKISKYEAGMEIPASILKRVLETQSWKVENGKQEESKETKETTASSGNGKKEEIKDITINRMVKSSEVKKKG